MQRAYEFRIEFGNGTGDEAESPAFPETGGNLQGVSDEIEANLKNSLIIRYR